jgi:hypothetical protein
MENWVERKTPQGRMYYCNLITQETTWDYDDIDENTGQLVKQKCPPLFFIMRAKCDALETTRRA